MKNNLQQYWNNNWSDFRNKSAPWDPQTVDQSLLDYFDSNLKTKIHTVLEIGCGSGINTVWLSEQNYEVTAIDISSIAIDIAVENSKNLDKNIKFEVCDINEYNTSTVYDFIFDRGCYHNYLDRDDKVDFFKKVQSLLSHDGHFLLIAGAENKNQTVGPPNHSLTSIVECLEQFLEILQVKKSVLNMNDNLSAPAWTVIAKNKA